MASDITQSTLNLTPEEKRSYGQLFQQADTDKLGVVTGDIAVKFFERTKLDSATLAEIWQLADIENRGLLTPAGFSVALRLIGHCQNGREPSTELAKQPGPLPRFDTQITTSQSQTAAPSPPPLAPQTSGPIRIPPLTFDKVNEYSSLFDKAGARSGFLSGDAAKQVFERARLPNEALGQIWNLADTEQRGALNSTEFVIAMHLIASMKTGSLRAVPYSLPPGLYEAASRRAGPPPTPPPRQYTGQMSQRPESPLTRGPAPQPISPEPTGGSWLVSPQDKAKFDQLFASIDQSRSGSINGEQAVQFFSTSGLSEDILASIWDLADINSEGRLSRDEFAVAMYLIRQQRGKREDRGNLPTTLPPNLIPPSMRHQTLPPSQPTAPTFDNAAFAPQQPKSAADDLFGLDAMSATDTGSQPTPASPASPQRSVRLQQQQTPGSPPQPTTFRPFVPTSSFGQELAAQEQQPNASATRALPTGVTSPARAAPSGGDDLLGDNDPLESSKLTSETTDLGNMSNQIGQLRTQMQEIQNKKSTSEAELGSTVNQKRELEQRLAQFRTQYEQEIQEVKALEDRLNASRAETRKVQQDLAMVEGAYQDLQTQHQQVSAALEADQRENASLKERLQQTNTQVSQLRPQLDQMRANARQQRNLVTVNQRQLATTESERDKLQGEMNDFGDLAAQDKSIGSTSEPQAGNSGVTSPAPSAASQSTNPFFRRSPDETGSASMSPSIFTQNVSSTQDQSMFDSFFRSSEPAATSSTPPATTFRSSTPPSHDSTPPPVSTRSVSTYESSPAVEPPAPPESRQMTSSSLPLRPSGLRTESVSSSVKANPPASRAGEPMIGTPTKFVSTPAESLNGDAGVDQVTTTSGAVQSRNITAESSNASQIDTSEGPSAVASEHVEDAIPGAFPEDTSRSTSTLSSTPVEPQEPDLTQDENSASAQLRDAETTTSDSSAPQVTLPSSESNRAGAEFPAIQNLQEDSDSSGDSEEGLDEEFDANATNATSGVSAHGQTAINTTTGLGTLPLPKPNVNEIENDTSELPTPTAQTSPPTYNQAVPLDNDIRESNQFPREYDGLLPSREMTHSPPVEIPQSRSELSPPTAQEISTTNGPVVPSTSNNVDEFDSAFADLSDSKEADEAEGQDSFVLDSNSHDNYEFNPTFESPAIPRLTSNSLSSQETQSTPATKEAAIPAPSVADTFANFQPSFGSSTLPFGSSSGAPNIAASDSSTHDWDEIFAGLDSNPSTSQGGDPFALQDANFVNTPATTSASTKAVTPSQAPKPPLARATSAGEHDDPILKTLTNMGYDREEAVKALEKYDYNLDMAADDLASRH